MYWQPTTTTQAHFQSYSQLLQRRGQGENLSVTLFSGRCRECFSMSIRITHGRTPLSLACGWSRRIGLEDIERCATSPRTPIPCLGQRLDDNFRVSIAHLAGYGELETRPPGGESRDIIPRLET